MKNVFKMIKKLINKKWVCDSILIKEKLFVLSPKVYDRCSLCRADNFQSQLKAMTNEKESLSVQLEHLQTGTQVAIAQKAEEVNKRYGYTYMHYNSHS